MRLKDSVEWVKILTNIFGFYINIIKDYETCNKPIKELYISFKNNYKIPINLLEEIKNDKYLNYYYSIDEINEYYNLWLSKSEDIIDYYTYEQYKLYENISIENCHIDIIQLNHYFDEGCTCKACCIKRSQTVLKILNGIEAKDKIVHSEAKNQLIQKRVLIANNINNIIRKIPTSKKKRFYTLKI